MVPEIGQRIRTIQHTTDNEGRLSTIKAKGVVTKLIEDKLYPIVMEGINERKETILLYINKDGWEEWTD